MNILNYKLYYFLGVGGIGMSALGRFFNHYHKAVFGYDTSSSELCKHLENEGITCHYDENVKNLELILANYKKEEVLIIYTPAVPKEHLEYQYLLNKGYKYMNVFSRLFY